LCGNNNGGVIFHLCGGIGLAGYKYIEYLEGDYRCYKKKKILSREGVSFWVTPKVFSPIQERTCSPSPLIMFDGHLESFLRQMIGLGLGGRYGALLEDGCLTWDVGLS
jgi:hypothetical protein